MAVQKSRKSRSHRNMRRKANTLFTGATLSVEAETGETHRRHHVTESGFYRGRKLIEHSTFAVVDEE